MFRRDGPIHEHPSPREIWNCAMVSASDPIMQRILQRLHDPDPVARRNAVAALRLNGARSAAIVSALTPLLEDGDQRVRCEARRTLDLLRSAAA